MVQAVVEGVRMGIAAKCQCGCAIHEDADTAYCDRGPLMTLITRHKDDADRILCDTEREYLRFQPTL